MNDLPHAEGQPASSQRTFTTLVAAAPEDVAAAVEHERRHLAQVLQNSMVDPLNLLLMQANAYEQSLGGNPTARTAVSVLAALARQVLQGARDLEASLQPTVLDELGLEPALEALSSQIMRVHGLRINLTLARLRERLPARIELALFRAIQEVVDQAVRHTFARQLSLRVVRDSTRLSVQLIDHGGTTASDVQARTACQQVVQLGGSVERATTPHGGTQITLSIDLAPPVQLTAREAAVLRLLTEGLSNKAIAARLNISPRTVNFHLDHIYAKLGVNSRTEAVVYAHHYLSTLPASANDIPVK